MSKWHSDTSSILPQRSYVFIATTIAPVTTPDGYALVLTGNANTALSYRLAPFGDIEAPRFHTQWSEMNDISGGTIPRTGAWDGVVREFYTADLFDAKQEIQAMLDNLLSGRPLLRSEGLQALAAEVVQEIEMRQEVVDVTQWARRLAADVAQATD